MGARTTIRLDDDLMRQLKERAKKEDVSVSSLMNQMLRQALNGTKCADKKVFQEKTYDMGEPLIDLTHMNAVLDDWDVEEFLRKTKQSQ